MHNKRKTSPYYYIDSFFVHGRLVDIYMMLNFALDGDTVTSTILYCAISFDVPDCPISAVSNLMSRILFIG